MSAYRNLPLYLLNTLSGPAVSKRLRLGSPKVSTDTPFVRSLPDAVYIAKDREDFAMLVEEALQ
ncbi:MAG: hypothetical protein HY663_02955, partial [Chloroflexi bacterium]|nr:hypothetical protein [Chloroflexota bacterium]